MSDDVAVEDHVLSDAELITAVRRGDTASFGVLFARHSGAATAVARRYLPASDADDAVAGAFEKVLGVLRAGKGPDVAFRAYLFTVVRRRAVEMLERGRRAAPTDDDHVFESAVGPLASSEDPALKGFEDSTVARAFQALPERWRSVLWYTDIEGLAPADVAPALGMTPNAVSALAYRAREGLRQAYLQAHLADVADDDVCARTNAQLGAYVRGGLSRRESTRVEEHLEDCARCRAVALELGDLAAGMRATVAPLVVGLLGLAALGGLPLVLAGAGASAAGSAGGAGGSGTDGRSTASQTAVGAGVGAGAGLAAASTAGGGGAAIGVAGGAAAAGAGAGAGAGAAGGAAAAGVAAGAARLGPRWLVGAAAGVAGLLVAGGLAIGAGWFDDDAPPAAGPSTTGAPSAPGGAGTSALPSEGTTEPGTTTSPTTTSPTSTPTDDASVPTTTPTTRPTTVPTQRPTSAPTTAPTSRPTSRPTDRPTTDPTPRPTQEPTTRPTTEPTPAPPTTAPPTTPPTAPPTTAPPTTAPPTTPPVVDPPAVVTLGTSTVLVAGGAGVVDLRVQRPTVLTAPLSVRVTLPAAAEWDGAVLATSGGPASAWVCTADTPRTATCTLMPDGVARRVAEPVMFPTAVLRSIERAAAPRAATVTDTLPFAVRLAAGVVDLGALHVDVTYGDADPVVGTVPLGRALAVELDAGTTQGTLVLRSTENAGTAATTTLDVTNPGRALDAVVVEIKVPQSLTVVGEDCVGSAQVDGTTILRCVFPTLEAGGSHSVKLRVQAVAGAPLTLTRLPVTLTATVGATSHEVASGVDVQIDTERAALRDRFQGSYRAYEIGAPTIHCAVGARTCLQQAAGNVNNDAVSDRVVLDGQSGRPLSTSSLTLPAGARVVGAYLTWGASYPGAVPGDDASRARGTLIGPDGVAVPVAGRSRLASTALDGATLGGRDYVQGTADVTAEVRRATERAAGTGAETWSFVPEVPPRTAAALFGGWSLTVVVEEPGAPRADVRIYDALEILSGSTTSEVSFVVDEASDVRLGVTVWEGDRGITGDKVTLDGAPLLPVGGLANPDNAFDSTATGFAVPGVAGPVNSFGVDVRGFAPATVAAGTRTLTFGTSGDAFALAAFTLTLTPRG